VQTLEENNELNVFCSHRKAFEDLLVKHKYIVNQLVSHFGSGDRSLKAVLNLYRHLLDGVRAGKQDSEIIPDYIAEDHRLEFIKTILDYDKGVKVEFTSGRKSAVFLKTALDQALCCGICGARLHRGSIQIDHIQDKKHGGKGSEDNGALTHPYCNSTFKDWKRKQELEASS
jgi:hypothetical protein